MSPWISETAPPSPRDSAQSASPRSPGVTSSPPRSPNTRVRSDPVENGCSTSFWSARSRPSNTTAPALRVVDGAPSSSTPSTRALARKRPLATWSSGSLVSAIRSNCCALTVIAVGLLCVEIFDLLLVLRGDRLALQLHCRRQLVATGQPLAGDDLALLDLLDPRQFGVGLIYRGGQRRKDQFVRGQLVQGDPFESVLRSPDGGVVGIKHDQGDVVR